MKEFDHKYLFQECQDDELTKKFREFHQFLVDHIINFCKGNNIEIDDFCLNADGVRASIPYGTWQPCTDSYFELCTRNENNEKSTFLVNV